MSRPGAGGKFEPPSHLTRFLSTPVCRRRVLHTSLVSRTPPRILDGVLTAVDRTFAAGFLQRDVKPANILVSEEGAGILADFGLVVRKENASSRLNIGAGTGDYSALEVNTTGSVLASELFSVAACFIEQMLSMCPFNGEVRAGVRKASSRLLYGTRVLQEKIIFAGASEKSRKQAGFFFRQGKEILYQQRLV